MATVETVGGRILPNLEELERGIAELPDRWLPQAREMLDWAERWVEGWNAHDLDALTQLVTDDIAWKDPVMMGDTVHGRAELREYIETFWRGFPDVIFVPTAAPYLAIEGMRMAVPWRMTGTLTGELAWWGKRYGNRTPAFAPTGRRADLEGFDVYEFRDGLLCGYTIVCDLFTLSQQLGLLPPPDSRRSRLMLILQRLTAPLMRRWGGSSS
jgi:hypothetical protein